jgi:hypothetical protein
MAKDEKWLLLFDSTTTRACLDIDRTGSRARNVNLLTDRGLFNLFRLGYAVQRT